MWKTITDVRLMRDKATIERASCGILGDVKRSRQYLMLGEAITLLQRLFNREVA